MRLWNRLVLVGLLGLGLLLSACDTLTGTDEIAQLETQNAQLQGTIAAVGTPMLTVAALEALATQHVILQAQLSQAESEALAARATLTVLELTGAIPGAGATPIVAAVPPGDQPPALPTPSPSPNTSQTQFTQTVTATDRDAADCPLGITTVFETTEDTIYVITRINVLKAGSTLSARWMANGSLFFDDTRCWVPDQDWFDICAYCSIVPDTGTFEPGNWNVSLLLDGQLMAEAQFQVVEPGGGALEATETPAAGTTQ